jgi:hypothetical protein
MKGEDGKMNGKQDFILVDLPAFDKGEWKVLAKATHTGEPSKTITFRQYFSSDDKLIYQSAGDRMWVLDAATLKLVDEKMTKPAYGENHDVMPSPRLCTQGEVSQPPCLAQQRCLPGSQSDLTV